MGGRCNEQADGSGPSCLAAASDNRGEDPSVRAGGVNIRRQRIERRLGSLQTILSSGALLNVFPCMRGGRELSHRDGADSNLPRENGRVELLKVDDHGRIKKPALMTLISHVALSPDRRSLQVRAKALVADDGRRTEHRDDHFGSDEAVATAGGQLSGGDAVACDDEGLTLVRLCA